MPFRTRKLTGTSVASAEEGDKGTGLVLSRISELTWGWVRDLYMYIYIYIYIYMHIYIYICIQKDILPFNAAIIQSFSVRIRDPSSCKRRLFWVF